MVAASPTALLLVDPDSIVVQANAAAEMLINASAAHIVGRHLQDILILPTSYNDQGGAFAAYDIPILTRRNVQFRADLLITKDRLSDNDLYCVAIKT